MPPLQIADYTEENRAARQIGKPKKDEKSSGSCDIPIMTNHAVPTPWSHQVKAK